MLKNKRPPDTLKGIWILNEKRDMSITFLNLFILRYCLILGTQFFLRSRTFWSNFSNFTPKIRG